MHAVHGKKNLLRNKIIIPVIKNPILPWYKIFSSSSILTEAIPTPCSKCEKILYMPLRWLVSNLMTKGPGLSDNSRVQFLFRYRFYCAQFAFLLPTISQMNAARLQTLDNPVRLILIIKVRIAVRVWKLNSCCSLDLDSGLDNIAIVRYCYYCS